MHRELFMNENNINKKCCDFLYETVSDSKHILSLS